MPALRPNVPPPPDYYANNLLRVVETVSRQYSDILLAQERDYLSRVLTLSVDARRLYARLLMRKGPLIRVDSLDYSEVSHLPAAFEELEMVALLQRNPPVPADQVLATLTRVELDDAFPHACLRRGGVRKDGQIAVVAARYPDWRIRERVGDAHPVCSVVDLEFIATVQILFFGDARTDLATLVLEDLGMVRFESYDLDPARRQFGDRSELDDYLAMQSLREALRALETRWQRTDATIVLDALWQLRTPRALERLRGGLVNRLGRCAERAGDFDVALRAYARASCAPGRERHVRLLRQLGDDVAATALLDAIDRAPLCAGERYFAQRFRVGGRARARAIPEQVLRLPGPVETNVEAAALAALTRNGGSGRHLENRLPLGMLGLAFWDVVFAPVDAAFVNPYQDRPVDLYWHDFRRARTKLIESRFGALRGAGAVAQAVCATAYAKRGIGNALVDWRALDPQLIGCASRAVPNQTWLAVFDYMLDDLEQTRRGFPDLALFFGRGRYQFVEVKGPGDQLRREQRLWFEFFATANVPALVLRVEW